MEDYDYYEEGEWLLGIGSTMGICANTHFGMSGGGTSLGKVVLADGTEVCRSIYYKDEDFNSIETVCAVGDARAVYYDLQGQRAENPVRGIYLKVSNGEVSKVSIR